MTIVITEATDSFPSVLLSPVSTVPITVKLASPGTVDEAVLRVSFALAVVEPSSVTVVGSSVASTSFGSPSTERATAPWYAFGAIDTPTETSDQRSTLGLGSSSDSSNVACCGAPLPVPCVPVVPAASPLVVPGAPAPAPLVEEPLPPSPVLTPPRPVYG